MPAAVRPVVAAARDVEGRRVGRHVDDHGRALVVRVQGVRVEDRIHLEPADLSSCARQQTDPRRVLLVPDVRHGVAPLGSRGVEGDGQIEDHDVLLGEREVVHHRRVRHRDPRGPRDPARVVDHLVPDVVPGGVVGDRVQFSGRRVELGVGGEGPFEGAAEVVRAHRVELVVEFVRQRPALLEGQDPSLVPDHMGVAREVVRRDGPGVRLAELLRHGGRADPAVAVPLRATVPQPHAVHHALTEHPVVGARVLQAQDVGAVAQEAAVQLARDTSGDREVERRQLLGDGLERPLQEGNRCPPCAAVPGIGAAAAATRPPIAPTSPPAAATAVPRRTVRRV